MLMMENGIRTMLIANITVKSLTPNQMMASRVQPIPENELRNGLSRPCTMIRNAGR